MKDRANNRTSLGKMKVEQKVVLKSFRRDRNKKNSTDDSTEPLLASSTTNKAKSTMAGENGETGHATSRNVSPNLKDLYNRFLSGESNNKTKSPENNQSRGRSKNLTWKVEYVESLEMESTNGSSTNTADEQLSGTTGSSSSSAKKGRRRGVSLPSKYVSNRKSIVSRGRKTEIVESLVKEENLMQQCSTALLQFDVTGPDFNQIKTVNSMKYGKVANYTSNNEPDKKNTVKSKRRASIDISTSKRVENRKEKIAIDEIRTVESSHTRNVPESNFHDVYEAITRSRSLAKIASRIVPEILRTGSRDSTSSARTDSISSYDDGSTRSASVSVCGNQALLNTIDPVGDDNNSTCSDKENGCDIKLQLDFSGNMINEINFANKEKIEDGVQIGYVSQVVAQMEGVVANKKSLPKPKNQLDNEISINRVKSLLSRLENNKEAASVAVKENQNCGQIRQAPPKKWKEATTIECSDGDKASSREGLPVSSKGCSVGPVDKSKTLVVSSIPLTINTDELKKENERLLAENKTQRKQIDRLETELKVVNEKLMKLYAEQFVKNRKSVDVKSRVENKVKELQESVKVLNTQRFQGKLIV